MKLKYSISVFLLVLSLAVGVIAASPGTEPLLQTVTRIRNLVVRGNADIGGNTTVTGNLTVDGSTNLDVVTFDEAGTFSGGLSVAPNAVIAAPTSIATATPVFMINSAGGVSNLAEIRKSSTPQWTINTSGNVTQVGNLTLTASDATIGDDLNVTDDTTLSGFLLLPRQSVVVTAAFIITPTASLVVLTSTEEFTSSTTIPIETTGIVTDTVLFLRNDNAADPINIDGTGGSVECKANVALGADDMLMLIFNGTDWNCVSSYDNS